MATETLERPDIVSLCIGFDEGTLDVEQALIFAGMLINTGMVNSTGTYQRFVATLVRNGFIDVNGGITEAGFTLIDEETK